MVSYWANAFDYPTTPTPDPNPLQNLPGSADDGSATDINNANAEELFPYMDGTSAETSLPNPKDSDGNEVNLNTVSLSDITPEFFSTLHSGQQLQLLNRRDVRGELVLEDGDDRFDVLRGSDGRTVLVLQGLSKTDLAPMSNADQKLIADYTEALNATLPDVVGGLAASLGVELGESASDYRDAMSELVQNKIDAIAADGSEYDEVFIDELELIQDRINSNSLFSSSNINSELNDLEDRYERIRAFENAVTKDGNGNYVPDPEDTDSVPTGLNSLDNNATIIRGLDNLVAQEKRLLNLAEQRVSISKTAVLQGKKLDLPSLISMLQLNYNIKKETDVAILTEELQQQNALLRDYATMQSMVNDVLKAFPSGEEGSEQERNIDGSEGEKEVLDYVIIFFSTEDWSEADLELTTKQRRALMMFSERFSGAVGEESGHPIEVLRKIDRPLETFSKEVDGDYSWEKKAVLVPKTQSAWNIFSTQLSDAVTLINQNSQILTNEISSLNQERNRHFDLANNALRRLNDSLTQIARI